MTLHILYSSIPFPLRSDTKVILVGGHTLIKYATHSISENVELVGIFAGRAYFMMVLLVMYD